LPETEGGRRLTAFWIPALIFQRMAQFFTSKSSSPGQGEQAYAE
jgi:hypothetical protein